MQLLDCTLPTAAENLALDEALLQMDHTGPVLRLWHPTSAFVVVGRGSRLSEEVAQDFCRRRGIPVLRRISGGAAIVTGPGCLMYSLVWEAGNVSIDHLHTHVLQTMAAGLSTLGPPVVRAGISDLALQATRPATPGLLQKISGNSLRRTRQLVLYHGTLLVDFDLALIGQCLRTPPRRPAYRHDRPHGEFVTNLSQSQDAVRSAIVNAWSAHAPMTAWPAAETQTLATQKYQRDSWNAARP